MDFAMHPLSLPACLVHSTVVAPSIRSYLRSETDLRRVAT